MVKLGKIGKKSLGQSTLEYLLLFAAVTTVIIVLVADGGPFRAAAEDASTAMIGELTAEGANYSNYLSGN